MTVNNVSAKDEGVLEKFVRLMESLPPREQHAFYYMLKGYAELPAVLPERDPRTAQQSASRAAIV